MLEHRGRSRHPEKPERLTTTLEVLERSGLLARCCPLGTKERLASDEELLAVHTAEHVANVAAASLAVQERPDEISLREPQGDGAIYYHEATEHAARCAAGSVVEAVEAVLCGDVHSAFALVRPPGHHAESDAALGFCFYNNIAVAAASARRRAIASPVYGSVQRVAIVDWDVHHGNGTQEIFESDSSVLFVSLHRYGRGFFPGTGALDEVGEGEGRGKTVNVPWMQAGLGDADYEAAFALVVLPILREFAPQLLLISAGFDAALGDVQGKMRMSPDGYARLTRHMLAIPGCAKVVAFEGGYHLGVSAACTEAVLTEMLTHTDDAHRGASTSVPSAGEDGGRAAANDANDAEAPSSAQSDGAGIVATAIEALGSSAELSEHTEATLRKVLDVQREHWACLRSDEHALALEVFFGRRGERGCRKRSRAPP